MAKFPRAETDVLGLAQEIADGLAANTEIYPAPPVCIEDLKASIADCAAARDAVQRAKSMLEQAVDAKNTVFAVLEDRMKKEIRYAAGGAGSGGESRDSKSGGGQHRAYLGKTR
uniref:Uncharacterized protein n=1 Tax=Candidatus Kentrum sp. MB TaxID=2138164 RepID=A0A451BH67_9GAMM|nr:MAG: hypothetical protein BECKMB1821H_GA0114242_11962 [Candidatus Kentron sp. MB]